MAKYTSKYKELSFYVGESRKSFIDGVYITKNPKEENVLDKMVDAKKVEEKKKQTEDGAATKRKPVSRQKKAEASEE